MTVTWNMSLIHLWWIMLLIYSVHHYAILACFPGRINVLVYAIVCIVHIILYVLLVLNMCFLLNFTLSMLTLTCIEIVLSFHDVLTSKLIPSMITWMICKHITNNIMFPGRQHGRNITEIVFSFHGMLISKCIPSMITIRICKHINNNIDFSDRHHGEKQL